MNRSSKNKLWAPVVNTTNFFVPRLPKRKINHQKIAQTRVAILIPTYKPSINTYRLVKGVVKYAPSTKVIIIDDCTPLETPNLSALNLIKKLVKNHRQVKYLRTPQNSLKAGALNYGIKHLRKLRRQPQVVITCDDDVQINKDTIRNLISALYSESKVGAVCSWVLIKNKDKNLLTRLQSMEYHAFNLSKVSDNGFLSGPLVMQGMMTAFRWYALKGIRGFAVDHLIEDYEITARLKSRGYKVKFAKLATASTRVPETIEQLWKQRVRWTYGGLTVVSHYWKTPVAVFQDLIGHLLFLSLLGLIALSYVYPKQNTFSSWVVSLLLIIALLNFIVAFGYNIFTLINYPNRDRKDILLKVSILPEFIYSNILSTVLMGSYAFLVYNYLFGKLTKKVRLLTKPYKLGLAGFGKFGYSVSWGTRQT